MANVNTHISLKVILDDLLDHPLMQDLTLERVVNYTQRFIQLVGVPSLFEEKTCELEIKDYRAKLPEDFARLLQARKIGNRGSVMTDTQMMKEGTGNFFMSKVNDEPKNTNKITYKVQGSVIFTSFKEGNIEISYLAMYVDDEGLPMIDGDPAFVNALELYIKKQIFTTLFDLNKINNQVYQVVKQDYAFAVAQVRNRLLMPDYNMMQNISNMFHQLLPSIREWDKGFKNINRDTQ
jgi:hypothetical protein